MAPRYCTILGIALLALVAGCDDDNGTDPNGTGGSSAGCGSCPTGKICCMTWGEHRCIDPELNPDHCGGCESPCIGQTVCQGGNCVTGEPCPDAGACSAGECCLATGLCCPPGTECQSSVPDFNGCCPEGDVCVCTGSNCPVSRRIHKRDVKYLDPAEQARLREELLRMRLATYRYRHAADQRTHLGFIMDDVEPSVAADSSRGVVDLYSYTSMVVATVQTQAAEIETLRREVAELRRAVAAQRHASAGTSP